MKRLLRRMVHLAREFAVGYGIGGFLLIAALTSGVLQGRALVAQGEDIELVVTVFAVLRLLASELVLGTGYLLCRTHPFGCAGAVGILLLRSFQTGLLLGWRPEGVSLVWVLLIGTQTALALLGDLTAFVVSAYAALGVNKINNREECKCIAWTVLCRCISVVLRCAACMSLPN